MFGQRAVMLGGRRASRRSALVINAFVGWWPFALACLRGLGLGFYLLHGSIQVYMTELAPQARGSAAALHSSSFFLGQAIGPVVYGVGFAWYRVETARADRSAVSVIALVGVMAVRLLHDRGHAT